MDGTCEFRGELGSPEKCNFSSVNYPLYTRMVAEFAIAFIVKCINLNVATNCHYQCVALHCIAFAVQYISNSFFSSPTNCVVYVVVLIFILI